MENHLSKYRINKYQQDFQRIFRQCSRTNLKYDAGISFEVAYLISPSLEVNRMVVEQSSWKNPAAFDR